MASSEIGLESLSLQTLSIKLATQPNIQKHVWHAVISRQYLGGVVLLLSSLV